MSGGVKGPNHSYDRVQPQQLERNRRIIEIDLSAPDGLNDVPREGFGIHLQAESQGGARAERLDGFIQAKLICPELFIPECIKAKNVLALLDHPERSLASIPKEFRAVPHLPARY